MPRRASSQVHPGLLLGALAAIALLVVAGKTLLGKSKQPFADLSPLVMAELLENANSLRGNEYVVVGQIDEKLQWTADRGQLLSVRVSTPGGDAFLGIEVPPSFHELNLDVRQDYAFRVKFRQGGIAVATDVRRR
jgi:hypothetical protein